MLKESSEKRRRRLREERNDLPHRPIVHTTAERNVWQQEWYKN
jgi:hypothetical protein